MYASAQSTCCRGSTLPSATPPEAEVKAAIPKEPSLKVAEINVETFKGVVQLSGFESSRAAMDKAVEAARGVSGVTSVRNGMRLK